MVRGRFGHGWTAVVRVESRHERPQARRDGGYDGIAQLYLCAGRRQGGALEVQVAPGELGGKEMEPKERRRNDAI